MVVSITQLRADPASRSATRSPRPRRKSARSWTWPSVEQQALAASRTDAGNDVDDRRVPRGDAVDPLRILFLADVFGPPGAACGRGSGCPASARSSRSTSASSTARTRPTEPGMTPKLADRLLAAGADVVTLGNHVWRRDGDRPLPRDVRPRDPARRTSRGTRPARGLAVATGRATARRSPSSTCSAGCSSTPAHGPFEIVDELVEEARARRRSSSSTSTPRRRARRSRWPAGSTAG